MKKHGTFKLKKNLAEMLKGGVIMDVVNSEQAKIAELETQLAELKAQEKEDATMDDKAFREVFTKEIISLVLTTFVETKEETQFPS